MMNARFNPERILLCELKHSGKAPAWLTSFIRERATSRERFSKYCFAIAEGLHE
jgi:hypothetical protein